MHSVLITLASFTTLTALLALLVTSLVFNAHRIVSALAGYMFANMLDMQGLNDNMSSADYEDALPQFEREDTPAPFKNIP